MKYTARKISLFFALAVISVFPVFREAQAAPGEPGEVHQTAGNSRCTDCHSWLPFENAPLSFRDESERICAGCHREAHGKARGLSHPVDIVPSMSIPRDMALDRKGRITCITCHKFHSGYKDPDGKKLYFLRRTTGKAFCYSCHKKRLF